MDRGRFKFNRALKANLFQICRLCGKDNPFMIAILSEKSENKSTGETDTEIYLKIRECVGFRVSKDDKLPQKVCSLCVDKINEFSEFRKNCNATNEQLRSLLGVKEEQLMKETNCVVEVEESKRARKRKSDENLLKREVKEECKRPCNAKSNGKIVKTLAKRATKNTPLSPTKPIASQKGVRLNKSCKTSLRTTDIPTHWCKICDVGYQTKQSYDLHFPLTHTPYTDRYKCTLCNETIEKSKDVRTHQIWHKSTITPFKCVVCNNLLYSVYSYNRHMKIHCYESPESVRVLDRQCPRCHSTFPTHFLYNIHPCAAQTMQCVGCNRQQRTEADYLRHVTTCPKNYLSYTQLIPAAETHSSDNQDRPCSGEDFTDLKVCDEKKKTSKQKSKKKHRICSKNLMRVDELLKTTLNTFASIKHEPEIHIATDGEGTDFTNKIRNECIDDITDMDEDFYVNVETCDSDAPAVDDGHERSVDDKSTLDIAENSMSNASHHDEDTLNGRKTGLKLKIKKKHGTLNSSLLISGSERSEKKKKKKRRKHSHRHKNHVKSSKEEVANATSYPSPNIKVEPIDNEESVEDPIDEPTTNRLEGLTTSTPTIKREVNELDFNYNYDTDGYANQLVSDICENVEEDDEVNVKPNRLELDRMMAIENNNNNDSVNENVIVKQESNETMSLKHEEAEYGDANETDSYEATGGQISSNDAISMPDIKIKAEIFDKDDNFNDKSHTNFVISEVKGGVEQAFIHESFEAPSGFAVKQERRYSELYDNETAGDDAIEIATDAMQLEKLKLEESADCQLGEIHKEINLKIVSVASGSHVDFSLFNTHTEMNTSEIDINESQSTICGQVLENKENKLMASPFNESVKSTNSTQDISLDDDDIEEQQNLLNHDVAEQHQQDDIDRSAVEATAGVVVNANVLDATPHNEETENCINESADAAIQQAQHTFELDSSRNHQPNGGLALAMIHDDMANVNEIAENNNNANIERELREDHTNETGEIPAELVNIT